nr:hypothetical protein BaRGS_029705 [Batillaria attramentaria]
MTVNAAISVMAVLGVDDVQQTVKTATFLLLSWQDKAVAWNASDFGGIHSLDMPTDFVWMPNVWVFNALELSDVLRLEKDVVITKDGWFQVTVYFITETICNMDLTSYPYDEQTCPIVLGSSSTFISWTISNDHRAEDVAQELSFSGEWDLLAYNRDTAVVFMTFRRKTTFYTVCLVLPMVLTSYMNTLVFLVPLQSGEKVSFLVTIFVSTSVFVR